MTASKSWIQDFDELPAPFVYSHRTPVPGGWVVTQVLIHDGCALSSVFVPDPGHTWGNNKPVNSGGTR
jgi:hypothetical protein